MSVSVAALPRFEPTPADVRAVLGLGAEVVPMPAAREMPDGIECKSLISVSADTDLVAA